MRLTLACIARRASVRSAHYRTFRMVFLNQSTERDLLATHIEIVELMRADDETDEEFASLKQYYAAHSPGEVLKAPLPLSCPGQSTFTTSCAEQIS